MAIEEKGQDSFLNERLSKYDQWLAQGKISYSSKVVPIKRSLEACQYVLPTEQVSELLKNTKSIALAECDCRKHYKRCDNPLEVCFYLNDFADKFVKLNQAHYVKLTINKYGELSLPVSSSKDMGKDEAWRMKSSYSFI